VGIEAAGHYHQALAVTLRDKGFDVVELNPYQVKIARAQLGQARIKTDLRDCMAMVELLVRGQGWPLHRQDGAVAEQVALVSHRRRKQATAQALGSQIHALADLAFPGLTLCFRTGLESKTLRMLLATIAEPAQVAAMSPAELVRHAAEHKVRMLRPKAAQVIAAAAAAICVPEHQRATAARLLAGDMASFDALLAEQTACEQRPAEVLPQTPAQVLTSIPGVGVLTASYYGAALGDAGRFANADAAYRHSGLPRPATSPPVDDQQPYKSARSDRSSYARRSSPLHKLPSAFGTQRTAFPQLRDQSLWCRRCVDGWREAAISIVACCRWTRLDRTGSTS
jgi:transposase